MDTLNIYLSGDQYGSALPQAELWMNNARLTTLNVAAVHGVSMEEHILTGAFLSGTLTVVFKNDAWGGRPGLDRNLWIDRVVLNGGVCLAVPVRLIRTNDHVDVTLTPAYDATTFEDDFRTLSLQVFDYTHNPPPAGTPGNWTKYYHNGWPPNASATPPGTPGHPDVDPSARYCIGNNEAQCYEDEGVSVTSAGLVLTATRKPGAHFPYQPWTSGAVQQSNDFALLHGYLRVRAHVPHVQGMWPAIWMLAVGHEPPEIDILEVFGTTQPPDCYHAGAIAKYAPDSISQGGFSPRGLSDDFHDYGCRWDSQTIEFDVDGEVWKTIPTYPSFTYPMGLLINLAVGGPGCFVGQPDPALQTCSMTVRSVRTWAMPDSGIYPVSGARIPASPL